MTSLQDFQHQWDAQAQQAAKYRPGNADLGGTSTHRQRASRSAKSLPNLARHRSPGMPAKRNSSRRSGDLERSNSDTRARLSAAMDARPWPEGQSNLNTRDLVEDLPLAHNESITDPTMLDDDSDFDVDEKPAKIPSDDSDDDGRKHEKDVMMRNPFVDMTDGSPVEIVLIDRSKSRDSVRKLRIDENMNVSYWDTDTKTKRIVIGIVIFSLVVLITGLTVMFAGRNDVDHEQEYATLVHSMDRSARRLAEPQATGWDIWQMKLPTPPGYFNSTHTLDDLHDYYLIDIPEPEVTVDVKSYTAFVLVSEDHEDRWMKEKNSILFTFMKGSRVEIRANIFKGKDLFSQKIFYLGDAYIHHDDVYTTARIVLPPDENFTVYIKVTIAADGYRVYSMLMITTIEDMVSHLMNEDEIKADIVSLPLSQPWTDEDRCEETILCL